MYLGGNFLFVRCLDINISIQSTTAEDVVSLSNLSIYLDHDGRSPNKLIRVSAFREN